MPKFYTVDVFTNQRFGGNPLAVVMDAEGLDQTVMQAVSAEFNLSETTFVLPPVDPANTARVRIFNRTAEMPFAGHPMVGTAFVLAGMQPELIDAVFEVPAGLVRVRIDRDDDGAPLAATIAAPQPLSVAGTVAPDVIAKVLGLDLTDIVTSTHSPTIASNGNSFVIAEISRDALGRCAPDLDAFRAARSSHPQMGGRFAVHVYSKDGRTIRARMFAPLSGTWEDPATGSANAPLACLLLSFEPGVDSAQFEIHQGVEMGRPSLLHVEARRSAQGIVATLGGSCVSVMEGQISV
ncbi:PhzF family phenazine biosynthesis protein [Sphingomonas sp. SUN039]|uniref:PhzF family phenazine biosynthesis protein n=1 Tax=Sphingomonas sp. SUN039 TaxID=2937787 RepID=UPI002164D7B3|nr:PhzF family phenazine biosynthesis protein [Sphingomonas sp. SUN039]UVO54940.1 PhzF family phenazine biosynthesis protein [Sphingomonas sp. SUN039]